MILLEIILEVYFQVFHCNIISWKRLNLERELDSIMISGLFVCTNVVISIANVFSAKGRWVILPLIHSSIVILSLLWEAFNNNKRKTTETFSLFILLSSLTFKGWKMREYEWYKRIFKSYLWTVHWMREVFV